MISFFLKAGCKGSGDRKLQAALWSMKANSHSSSEVTLLVQMIRAIVAKRHSFIFLHVNLECFLAHNKCQVMILGRLWYSFETKTTFNADKLYTGERKYLNCAF